MNSSILSISGSNSDSIQGHRVVLCAWSDYFLEEFRGNQSSASKENEVELKEIEASKLKPIIDFMYSGSIKLSLETVDGILRTASFLKMKSLVDGCCKFIKKNIDSTSLSTLKSKTLEYTYTKFGAISKEEELLKLSENQLKDLQNCVFESKKLPEKLAIVLESHKGKLNVETFNAKENTWSLDIETQLPKMNNYYSLTVIDNKLIVGGGREGYNYTKSIKCFDLHTSQWKTDFPLMKKIEITRNMADLNGNLCVIGSTDSMRDKNFMELYNFSKRKWHVLQPLSPISINAQIATHNEMLYIIDFDNGYLQSYNANSKIWSPKRLNKDDLNFCFTAVEGFLYIFGGYFDGTDKFVKTVKRYNLSNDSWCEMASMPNHTRDTCDWKSIVYGDKIIVSDAFYVDEYNIDTDTWQTLRCLEAGYEWNIGKLFVK